MSKYVIPQDRRFIRNDTEPDNTDIHHITN